MTKKPKSESFQVGSPNLFGYTAKSLKRLRLRRFTPKDFPQSDWPVIDQKGSTYNLSDLQKTEEGSP